MTVLKCTRDRLGGPGAPWDGTDPLSRSSRRETPTDREPSLPGVPSVVASILTSGIIYRDKILQADLRSTEFALLRPETNGVEPLLVEV